LPSYKAFLPATPTFYSKGQRFWEENNGKYDKNPSRLGSEKQTKLIGEGEGEILEGK
jgi:hypothetical protein